MISNGDFIGKGWRFPIRVNARGGIDWSEGPARIQDAIWLVVKTSLGERVMKPDFGGGVNDYVFQSNSPALRLSLAGAIQQALTQWEPRIDLLAVNVDEVSGQPSQVVVSIDYRLRTTNELFNLVYPYYLQEGVG